MLKVHAIRAGMIVKAPGGSKTVKVTRNVDARYAQNCVVGVTGIDPATGEPSGFATYHFATVERVA